MIKHAYSIKVQVHQDGEYGLHECITKKMCNRKLKRYLHKMFKFRAENFKLDLLHIWRCDGTNDRLIDGWTGRVRFIKHRKEINNTF